MSSKLNKVSKYLNYSLSFCFNWYKRNITMVWNMTVCIFRVGSVDLYTDPTRGDSLEFDLCIDLHNQRGIYRLSYSIL